MTLISSKKITARIEHKCDYCGFQIDSGESYYRDVIKDGTVYTWKAHPACIDLANELSDYYCGEQGDSTMNDFHNVVNNFYEEIAPRDNKKSLFSDKMNAVKQYFKL